MKHTHHPLSLLLVLAIAMLSSCNSYEKLTYLQEIQETADDSLFLKHKESYTLQPGDLLYLQILTENEEINQLFNPNMGTGNTQMRPESMYYTGYMVSDSGNISLPLIREVYVQDLTIPQAQAKVDSASRKFLKDPQVILKLASFRFSVLGEVQAPGVKEVNAGQVNVFEALAHAGDITYNGNRKTLLLLRPTPRGTKTYRIDLTSDELIKSEHYYIQPNDILYVEPLGSTLFREQASDYVFVISAISSTLTAVALVLNLVN